jgi:hypothetical protein
MIITTLPFNAVLMRPANGLYHLFLFVKLIPNSILRVLSYELERKVVLTAQAIFRRVQMAACESEALSARRILLLMQVHILRVV